MSEVEIRDGDDKVTITIRDAYAARAYADLLYAEGVRNNDKGFMGDYEELDRSIRETWGDQA